jgi:hypothetical protein
MISRYDLMKPSITSSDSVDTQAYPDVLSANFGNFNYSQPPFIVQPDFKLQQLPYIITNAFYNVAAYDDIVLLINNVPHISFVDNFPSLNFPVLTDLQAFVKAAQ